MIAKAMPGRRVVAMVIAAVFAAFVFFNAWFLPGKFALRVQVETVRSLPMALIVWASGNLEAKLSLTAKAQFDAPIQWKGFREGQTVKKGELLAELSRDRILLDHQTKLDALRNAEADLRKARKDLRLQKALYAKQAVSSSSVEDAAADVVKKTQALSSAQETFRLEMQQWDLAKIYAPFDGTIVKDLLGDDKFVKADKELFTIADVSAYTLKAQVDELDIKQVHEGQKAEVRLQIYKDITLRAIVKEVGSQPEGTGLPQVPVVIALPDTKGLKLRPKLTGETRILTGITEPLLSVPSEAVSNADGEPRVWVVGFLNKIHSVPVTLGRTNPDRVEVKEGLQPGQHVCVSAEPDFSDGMRIVIGAPEGAAMSKTHALMRHLKGRPNMGTAKDAPAQARGLFNPIERKDAPRTHP